MSSLLLWPQRILDLRGIWKLRHWLIHSAVVHCTWRLRSCGTNVTTPRLGFSCLLSTIYADNTWLCIDQQADLWSVGAILYELLTKKPPFTGSNHLELLANIERHEATLPPDVIVSKECKTFMDRLLRRNPHMRMSFQVCLQ